MEILVRWKWVHWISTLFLNRSTALRDAHEAYVNWYVQKYRQYPPGRNNITPTQRAIHDNFKARWKAEHG